MRTLLDSNVLIALLTHEHVHHDAADRWFARHDGAVATCPITQGALIRLVLRRGDPVACARGALSSLTRDQRHEFWLDEIGYEQVRLDGVLGHRQVTDAYLAALARYRGGRVATLDKGFAALHGDVVELVPTAVS